MYNLKFKSIIAIFTILFFFSCSRDEEIAPADDRKWNLPDIASDTENIPQWIYDEMNFFYYWNDELPTQDPTGDEDPETHFNSLLNSRDRFSYISDDAEAIKEEDSGTITAKGFSTAFGVFSNSDNFFAVVEYVYPGSPADLAGLKRGDIILEIDGSPLDHNNFRNLTDGGDFSLTLGEFDGQFIRESNDVITINTGVIELNPVIHQEVKEVDGVKTGYLVFVDFLAGKDDVWLNSLENAIASMKAEGITEMILDLRYNPGGEVRVAENLASMLAPASAVAGEEVLVRFEYNDELQNYFIERQGPDSPNIVSRFIPTENNLDLSTIYILTTRNTASASELVINSLRPYMNVVQIGEPTFGKFYGAFLLYDENDPPKHNWAISPVALKYANANGVTDFEDGLSPDIFLQDDLLTAKEFGDESDPMLGVALSLISGTDVSSARSSTGRMYEPVYDLDRINRKGIMLTPLETKVQWVQ